MPAFFSELLFLPNESFRSQAKAKAEVIKSIGGRLRYLYELVSGENPLDGIDPWATPLNPDLEHGINLSGPPWGSALLHPIAWIAGAKASAGNVDGVQEVFSKVLDDGGTTAGLEPGDERQITNWYIRSRRYTELPQDLGFAAPYSRGYIVIRGWTDSGTATCRVRTWKRGQGDNKREDSCTFSSTTDAIRHPGSASVLDVWCPLEQDGSNFIGVEIRNSAASDDVLHITAIGVVQMAKRSH